jgi:hypothetical protein
VGVFVVVALGVAAALAKDDEREPAGFASQAGLYRVDFAGDPGSSPVNRLHDWRFELTDRDGAPVGGADVVVAGDMPAHGHGLPTQPVVRELDRGSYAIEGMKFQMGGHWYVELSIDGAPGADSARVEFDLAG